MKPWTQVQIEGHLKAATKLDRIMADTFDFIFQNRASVDEYQAQQFIVEQFVKDGLISDAEPPIVAFGKNTENVHYFPSKNNCSKLEENDLIMIDIWARENVPGTPFADITWMGFNGSKVPEEQLLTFKLVISARNSALEYIKCSLAENKLPILAEIDQVVGQVFEKEKVASNFLHTTGHVLGFDGAHGNIAGVIGNTNNNRMMTNVGYTIEPGLYFENKYGVRSEIDFYINEQFEVIVTTGIQENIVMADKM